MSTITLDTPTIANGSASTARPAALAHRILDLAAELDHDIGDQERKRVLAEVHALQRSLVSLEHELLEGAAAGRGDAC